MFNLLQPAPIAEEIQDPVLVKKKYKYWRLRTFYGMYIGYAFYYFSRKSFTFAIPSMLEEGFSLSELGMLGSILSITYGVSKFVSGIIGDKSNPRSSSATAGLCFANCSTTEPSKLRKSAEPSARDTFSRREF